MIFSKVKDSSQSLFYFDLPWNAKHGIEDFRLVIQDAKN